ncbi:hypothetical protein LCGC14_2167910 [marine sediment metagenome]|uniref:Uncharacterized protein n=1 Tax=marine sediment metagenome TaxID=412755 RepID=A0A0F9G3J6_9ZZZZ
MCDAGFYQLLLMIVSFVLVFVSIRLHEACAEIKRVNSNSKMKASIADLLVEKDSH